VSGDELRSSTRGIRVLNYADDVEDFEQFDEPHPGYYIDPNAQEKENDEIEAVLGHARDEGHEDDHEDLWYENIVSPSSTLPKTCASYLQFQRFHIKWKGFSHLRNTDETYEFLKRYKGLKRVDNYIKAFKAYQARLAAPGLTSEERETLLLDKEREKQDLELYKTVERVVSHRDGPKGEIEYFCKWNGLNYEHCTWEPLEEIRPIAKEELEDYRHREAEAKFPYKSVAYVRTQRPTFEKITEDPEYIVSTGGQLKDFQLTGLNWLAYLWSKGENGILADEMGLGKVRPGFVRRSSALWIDAFFKTVQTVSFLSYLFHQLHQYGPYLVIVPLSTITAWQSQFQTWAPDLNVITYIGTAPAREVIRKYEFGPSNKKLKLNVLLTTYELTLRDSKELGDIKWQVLAVDEVRTTRSGAVFLFYFSLTPYLRPIASRIRRVNYMKHCGRSRLRQSS
jgi:chromodomain-helicase-DNA-binding protein 1